MVWFNTEDADDIQEEKGWEGIEVMPAVIGILLVLLAGFQLFYRFDSWPSKSQDGVMYERDRLTGELHVVFPGDKVGLLDRVIGHYGHSPNELKAGDIPHEPMPKSDTLALAVPEPTDLTPGNASIQPTQVSQVQTNQPGQLSAQAYYAQAYPAQNQGAPVQGYPAPVQQMPVYQQPQQYQGQQVAMMQPPQGQTVVYPSSPQPIIVTIPNQSPATTIIRERVEREPERVIERQPVAATQTTQPKPLAVATVQAPKAKVSTIASAVPPKKSFGPPVAYQMNMTASEVLLRTDHQVAGAPIPLVAPSNPKPAFSPLVPQAKKPAAPVPNKKTVSQAFDLNHDGDTEQVIQAPRADGNMNISVVSDGKEILYSQGQQLQILPTRRQGWADLALINTTTGYRNIYQFDAATQTYKKTQAQPLRPTSLAQVSP